MPRKQNHFLCVWLDFRRPQFAHASGNLACDLSLVIPFPHRHLLEPEALRFVVEVFQHPLEKGQAPDRPMVVLDIMAVAGVSAGYQNTVRTLGERF